MSDASTKIPIISEMIEPAAATILGRMLARVEEARPKGHDELIHAWMSAWWVLLGFQKIAVGVSTATHFSLASQNYLIAAARNIERELGIDPMRDPAWGYTR